MFFRCSVQEALILDKDYLGWISNEETRRHFGVGLGSKTNSEQ